MAMMVMRGSSRRLRREVKEGGRCSFREESGKEEKERLASSLRLPLRADNAPTVSVSAGGSSGDSGRSDVFRALSKLEESSRRCLPQ